MVRLVVPCLVLLGVVLLGAGDSGARDAAMGAVERAALAGDWVAARGSAREWLSKHPHDPEMLYNDGCASCRMGEMRSAASSIVAAIKSGYLDFGWMAEDPDLGGLRKHESWRSVEAARDGALAALGTPTGAGARAALATSAMRKWQQKYAKRGYKYESDPEHRIHFAHDLDKQSAKEMRSMLSAESDLLARLLFGEAQPDWIFIAVTKPKDKSKEFEVPNNTGAYDHGTRTLSTGDTGASLRHEFAHALHFGHQQVLGQRHPIWIIEGLAALFEDYEVKPDGSISATPNQRHNLARHQVQRKRAEPLRTLAGLEPAQFMERPEQRYPQVRSIFEYLNDRALLVPFYREYTSDWQRDPTGIAAIERVTGGTIAKFEEDWKAWVLSRPPIDDRIEPGDGGLGVTLSEEADGARVTGVLNGSAAAAGGMRIGDVIVSINDKPVRSMLEVIEAIARLDAGDRAKVGFRRSGSYSTIEVTLKALRATN